MRLICPNCGAQYEVPADAIPPEGRDVQCSNCAHTWLERPGASAAAEEDGTEIAPVTEDRASDQEDATEAAEPVAAQSEDDSPSGDTGDSADAGGEQASGEVAEDDQARDEEAGDTASPPASSSDATMSAIANLVSGAAADDAADAARAQTSSAQTSTPDATASDTATRKPVRQSLSPGVADILREEAAREGALGTSEALGDEQPDLDLDRPIDREEQLAEEARRRMARIKGEPAVPTSAPVTQTSGARSELLPDIEEISSSLRSSADRAAEDVRDPEPELIEQQKRRGFRFGFTMIVLIFALLALAYVFAPQISEAVPAAEPALTSYVSTVDKGRLWLDLQLQSLLDGSEAASETGADPAAADTAGDETAPDAGTVSE